MRHFPDGKYGRQVLRFHAAPYRPPLRSFAVLVFAWMDAKVLVCDIAGRGWCVPSGRVEPDESSFEAVRRETLEEAGALLADAQYFGCYEMRDRREVRWADCYAANVEGLTEIGLQEESRGRQFVTMEELPEVYHVWNELTRLVFERSREVAERAFEWRGSD
ncbi:MAG: NUDIX domain-containing protein [Fimbriimonadaceae bacterium]|nr:NUDIX domain-containing protein [Fimbriimonadaceae bacterium]